MGLFSFLKRKKPTLAQDIKTTSAWIIEAMNSSEYKVSMELESLKEVDRFFNEQMDDTTHTAKQGGLLSEDLGQKMFALGAFIGEVLISAYGGEWITNDNDKQGEMNITVKLANGAMLFPVQRVMKRYKEGPENDIYTYAVAAG